MTTLAFDGRYIAVDSRLTCDGHISTDFHQKFHDGEKEVVFWSGAYHQADEIINSYLSGAEFSKPQETHLIVYDKVEKCVYWISIKDKVFSRDKVYWQDAMGSGACYAIGAMECGKSAVEALRIAIKRDSHTGGKIHCLDTHTGKFIKVKQ